MDFPQDILLEIFSRTPTKSIGKFRTLSKSWKTHLSSPIFINKHLFNRTQTIQQQNLALTTLDQQLHIITSPTKSEEAFYDESFPYEYFSVKGSCNGLILVNTGSGMFLINPITRKRVNTPSPLTTERKEFGYYDYVCGFGYDSCSNDFKIVDISSYKPNNDDRLVKIIVDVYSVKNGVWRKLDDGCYPFGALFPNRYGFEGGAFVNGALHWLICSNKGYRSCIAAFDLANEVFREIPLPKEFVRQLGYEADFLIRVRRNNGVSVVGECLVIVDNFGNGATDIWIMKEYGVAESWARFRIVAEDGMYKWETIVATLCYVEDGELLCMTSGDFLFACDLKGGTVRKVNVGGRDGWYAHGMAFVDSLVSPDGSP